MTATDIPRSEAPTDAAPATGGGFLDSYFKLSERGTTVGTEIKAGITTFMVMVYIVAVNPSILSNAGIDVGAAAAATALVAGVMSILMGVVANFPIAIAAGLGLNGVVAFGLVLGAGLTPAGAMGVVVLEGLVVTLLVVVGLREAIMNAVPLALKRAVAVGIGLFILFIGFFDGGLITAGEGVPVQFVFPNTAGAWVTLIGLAITIILFVRKVPAALLLSIVITSVIAFVLGVSSVPEEGLTVLPDFSTLGAFDLGNVWTLGALAAILTIFTLMLADFFDTMGTATAIAEQAGLTTEDGQVPGVGRLLLVDSLAAAAGGAAGISSNTSYIESAAGVAEGGRTGLTAVVVGVLFLVMIFLSPLVELVPFSATAPVLIVVGYLMATHIKDIDFTDVEEGLPALFGLILMPLTFSITVGIGAAFIAYVVIKAVVGKVGEVHPLMWVTAIAFAIYFAQSWLNTVL
ncbi:MAG TPA: NCS2 family permease [candidate division Zixibacteria bacterium]|nr:NCS2 family permease [candidate division Zixibacteria bacterium]